MTIQELGSLGEFVAAIATLVTLAYLAIQVRHNTRALRSATVREVADGMTQISQAISTHPELASLIVKASEGLENLSSEERVRYHFLMLMAFRRFETLFVQSILGTIDEKITAGFERSMLSIVASGGGAEWWSTGKSAFNQEFVEFVDRRLAAEAIPQVHPKLGGSV